MTNRIEKAVDIAIRYGQIDGVDHKMWVIDQMIRCLLGDKYKQTIKDACDGEDGSDTYEWDIGIPP